MGCVSVMRRGGLLGDREHRKKRDYRQVRKFSAQAASWGGLNIPQGMITGKAGRSTRIEVTASLVALSA